MITVKDEVAKNLRYFRKKKKLTQKQLANSIGVKHGAISAWENGKNSIYVEKLFLICEILNVSVREMFGIYANVQFEQYTQNEKTIVELYRELNDEGQKKVSEYVEALASTGNYKKSDQDGMVEEEKLA